MAQSKITYSFVGGSNNTAFPNIEGAAISRNMFTEANTDGKKDVRTFMQSAPGIRIISSLGSTDKCDGMFVPSTGLASNDFIPSLFVAYRGQIVRVDSAWNTEVIGSYALGNTVNFAESGGERAVLLWVDGQSINGYDLKTGESVDITLPQRINEDAFIKPTHIAVVSGSIVLNDAGSSYTYYSYRYPLNNNTREIFDLDNGVVQYEDDGITVKKKTVNSGEYAFYDDYGVQLFFNASTSSDKCIAISSVGPLLTLFGPSSIEFYQRGDAESYQTWQNTSYTINKEQGLEARYSLASVNHQQFCIGTGKANAKCVLLINGTNVSKISPLWLDKILNSSDVKHVVGWTYSKNNHSFYLFSIEDNCYCYDVTTNEWHIRSSRNFYNGRNKNYMPLYAAWFNNKIITGCCENGNLFELDENYYYEDFDMTCRNEVLDKDKHRLPLLRTRQTPVITTNYCPFIIFELALECNTGSLEKYGKPAVALLSVSNDGGYTFNNVIEASAGQKGQYFTRLKWLNLGMQRQCVLRVSYSEPSDFVISDSTIRFAELATGV